MSDMQARYADFQRILCATLDRYATPIPGVVETVNPLPRTELEARMADVRRRMTEAGAHYVIDRMAELPKVIDDINLRMKQDRYVSPTR